MLNRRFTYYLAFLSVVFLGIKTVSAQSTGLFKKSKDYYTSVGIGGGSSHYFGDLSPYSTFYHAIYSNVQWNGTVNYQYNLNERFAARFGFSYIRILGDDARYGKLLAPDIYPSFKLRNLHFRNDMAEFAITGIYSFIPLDNRSHRNQPLQFSPYIGAGIGLIAHNPKAWESVQRDDGSIKFADDGIAYVSKKPTIPLRDQNTEFDANGSPITYSTIVPVFPFVLGVKTKLNRNLILSVEGGFRFTLTDYLDDVGTGQYNFNSQFSMRGAEDYNAITGKSRADAFKRAAKNYKNGVPFKNVWDTPHDVYPSVFKNELSNELKGPRGTKHFDSYIVTQITLNYIISDRVKCPPTIH